MSKIIFSFLVFFLFVSFGYAESTNCEQKDGYPLYICRVQNTCNKYEKNSSLRVFNTEKTERTYQEGHNLYIAKNLYRENMNSIYKCGILKSQNNAYFNILNKLNMSNASLSNFTTRAEEQQERLDSKITALDCLKTENKDFNLKKAVLDESTLEMCKYLHFLDYVKETHILDLGNLIKDEEISRSVQEISEQNPEAGKAAYLEQATGDNYVFQENQYTIGQIIELESEARLELLEEVEHTKKVYEVAFQTYANYETNMVIHILFEMLENDFRQVRDKIYAMISPINQVSYKIPNAMSK